MLNVLQYNTQYLYTKVANDKQNKNFTYDLYELGIATVGKIKCDWSLMIFEKVFLTFAHCHLWDNQQRERKFSIHKNLWAFFYCFTYILTVKQQQHACLDRLFVTLRNIFEFCWVDLIKFCSYYTFMPYFLTYKVPMYWL